ncbi:type 1 fimbrial protein [Salmonella enterica]|nr:type 1 fimbrial protein [Salmonella enterica]EKC2694343.1 type 1 fimbrial protein [Salmonella enterica]
MNKLVKLSMLVASMIGTSSVIAAPQTGSMNVSGSLTASTCTISLSNSEINIPALTTEEINAKGTDLIFTQIPVTINTRSCSGHPAWFTLSNSNGALSVGKGKFKFPDGATGNPIYFTVSKSGEKTLINVNGSGTTNINANDTKTMDINITRGAGTSTGFEGAYTTDLAFNFSYN